VNPSAPWAVVGGQATDEPFSFAHYAAIESARQVFGSVHVHAVHLPYGFWWDTLRSNIELVRDGEPPRDPLSLDGAWIAAAEFVLRDDPRYEGAVEPLRAPLKALET
jgi:hypothetical protein